MKRSFTFALLLSLFAIAWSAAAETATLALMPFDNLSGVDKAPVELAALIQKRAEAKGWTVIGADKIDPILDKNRVRYLDSFDDTVRGAVITATGASAILTGTVYRYADGRNSVVALSARLVRADGTIAWGDIVALTADDTEGLFGFHKQTTAEAVGRSAVDELMDRFPSSTNGSKIVAGPSKPMFRKGPSSVVVPGEMTQPADEMHICILPLENASPTPDAARIVTDVLAIRLAASEKFSVIEPAVVRAAALKVRTGSFQHMNADAMTRLGKAIGTSLFLRGTVFNFTDPAVRATGEPQLDVDLTLTDIASGRVVWAAQHSRSGSDYTGLLLLGTVRSSVGLADHTVSEIIAAGVREMRREANVPKSARGGIKRNPEKHSSLKRGSATTGENQ